VRTLFAKNKVRFARAEQLCLKTYMTYSVIRTHYAVVASGVVSGSKELSFIHSFFIH